MAIPSGELVRANLAAAQRTYASAQSRYNKSRSGPLAGEASSAFREARNRLAQAQTAMNAYNAQQAAIRKNQANAAAKAKRSTSTSSGGGGGSRSSGGGGGGGGGGGVAAAPIQMNDDQIRDFLRANYGYLSAYFDHPEIGPVLREAAQQGYDMSRLQGKLYATNWWKTTDANRRDFEARKIQDPATVQRQIDSKKVTINNAASKLGLNMADGRLAQISEDSLRFGWTEEEVARAIAGEIRYDPNAALHGDVGQWKAQVKQISSDFLVGVSDRTAHDWAVRIAMGEADEDNVTSYFREMAKSKLPTLKPYIDQGMTPGQIIEPYREEFARLLEVSPTQIDFLNDPKWTKVLDTAAPDGTRRMMTISESQTYVRGLEDFRKTKQANEQGAQLVQNLGQAFGKLAGSAA